MERGTRIGIYELSEDLGEHLKTQIWKARDHTSGRLVKLIMVLPWFTTGADPSEVFVSEGRRLASLRHPNIVSTLDVVSEKSRSYIVTEYLEFVTLEARLKASSRLLSVEDVLSITYDVLAALEHAHSLPSGPILHGDVRTANILLPLGGAARVAGFGIQPILRFHLGCSNSDRPSYSEEPYCYSPERIRNPRSVDRRSDIYSFGCVLYEMLTGRPPFAMDSDFETKEAHLFKQPEPMRKFNKQVPFHFEWIVLRALLKDPNRRFQSAGEMASALTMAFGTISHDARTGEYIGIAWMEDDSTIMMDLRAENPNGIHIGDARFTYTPKDKGYFEILKHLDGLRPGETKPVPPWPE